MQATKVRTAIFRTDATARIGSGHLRRCITLARTLGSSWEIFFACRSGARDIVPALSTLRTLDLPPGESEADTLRKNFPQGCDLLIVDHYELGREFESACRDWACRIVVIDDLADRPHDCDVLLDQTPFRASRDYNGLVPAGCAVLVGPSYAILDPRFRKARSEERTLSKDVLNVLVNFGGVDHTGATLLAVEALAQTGCPVQAHIILNNRDATIEKICELETSFAFPPRIYPQVEDMADLMRHCDIAIGAGGVSALERSCVGLPSVIVTVAENQRGNATALETAGAAINLGEISLLTPDRLGMALHALWADRDKWHSMSLAGKALIDGLGAVRAAGACLPPTLAQDNGIVTLRPATMSDASLMLGWQSAPGIRAFSRQSEVPDENSHLRWLRDKLNDVNCVFNIIQHADEPAGVLRLDRGSEKHCYEISILVAPGRQRLGIGGAALGLARQYFPDAEMRATIKPENVASVRMFERCGFVRFSANEWRQAPSLN